jgi:hypothetical protein
MIFAFAEDGSLAVLDDLAAAQGECEGIDVEGGMYVFYADDGAWLRPRFTRPNRSRGLAFAKWVESGEYVLEREPRPDDVDDFDTALAAATALQPNGHFATLDAVRAHVAATRAALAPYLAAPG